jgi:monoamine oxidase
MYIQTKPIVIGHNFQNLKSSPMFEQSLQVAVIGAGMAGLLTARELKREGHRVIVFEKSN